MITQKTLSNFYHEFGTLIHAGVNILQALRSLGNSTSHPQLRRTIRGIASEIEKGASLTESMKVYPDIFSSLQLRIVEIGEKTGKLDKSLFQIGNNLDRNHRIQTKLITGFMYPVFLIHAAIFIPAIPTLFLEGFVPFLKVVSGAIALLYGFFLLIFVIVKFSNRNYGLKMFFQYFFGYVPVIGPLIKRLAIARFMWNLSALHGAGENMVKAVSLAAEGCGNIPIENAVFRVLPDIEQGGSLTLAFKKVRFFPSMVIEMLSAGEESGRIDDMLDKIAEYYEAESDAIIKRIVVILPVIVYLAVALYIGSIIIRFYTGYFNQIDNLFEGF
jgi:type IV pilus assembly protein PilC